MGKFSVLFDVSNLVSGGTAAGKCTKSKPNQYPFDSGSDLVNLADLEQKVDNVHWLKIYYSEFSTRETFGKCNFRWNSPDSDHIVRTELVCYNIVNEQCEDYGAGYTRSLDECGSAKEKGENTTVTAKFYSRDLDEYVWHDICFAFNDAGDCTIRFLNLLVKSSRFYDTNKKKKEALDLEGLPWHLIVSDLKNNFDLDFSNDKVKFSWEGPGTCSFLTIVGSTESFDGTNF